MAHSVFEIQLHLAWVTKYRKPVLVEVMVIESGI